MAGTSLRADSALSNVVQLPTAAPRAVHNAAGAIRAFRAAHPWPGHYDLPAHRDAARRAKDMSASEILLCELITVLSADQREMLCSRLDRFASLSRSPEAMMAAIIAALGHGAVARLAERCK